MIKKKRNLREAVNIFSSHAISLKLQNFQEKLKIVFHCTLICLFITATLQLNLSVCLYYMVINNKQINSQFFREKNLVHIITEFCILL